MPGIGGYIIDLILFEGMSLYQAELKAGKYRGYCNAVKRDLSEWYMRRRYLKKISLYAKVIEYSVNHPNQNMAEIAAACRTSTSTVSIALTEYLKKPKETMVLQSKIK